MRPLMMLVTVVLVMAAMLVLTMAPAITGTSDQTINRTATITSDGRHVLVSGPVSCTEGEKISIEVTLTQRSTGAVAEGVWQGSCTGERQQWSLKATTEGKNTFEEGSAEAVALGITKDHGEVTDAHQWFRSIRLV
jgi:hypothetical protein